MDLTTLGIAVDSTQVKGAAANFDAMAASGDKATASVNTAAKSVDSFTALRNAQYQAEQKLRTEQEATISTVSKLTAGQVAFMESLQRQADTAGLTKKALLELQAAELGLAAGAQPYIDKIASATEANKGHGISLDNNVAKIELVRIAHDAAIGSYSRMGSAMLVLGNATGLTSAVLTGLGLAIGAVAAASIAMIYAFEKGAAQSTAFANSLQLTGNYAYLSEGQFNSLARSIAKSGDVTIGVARDIESALVKSGRFSKETIDSVATATALLSKATGETTDQVVKGFVSMADGVYKWSQKANDSYNFLNAAQLQHIKTLEEQGKKQEAMIYVTGKLNDQLKGTGTNLGYLESAWKSIGQVASNAWDSMLGIGRKTTVEDQIASLQEKIAAANKATQNGLIGSDRFNQENEANKVKLANLIETQKLVDRQSESQARSNALRQAGIEVSKMEEQYASTAIRLKEALAAANAKYDAAGVSASDPQRIATLRAITESFGTVVQDQSRALAAAKLSFDLDKIKRDQDSLNEVYRNASKVLDDQRKAGLLTEAEYWSRKQAFNENSTAGNIIYLEAEKKRLLEQTFSGAQAAVDQIKNKQAVQDVQAKIDLMRSNGVSVGIQLDLQEAASKNKVAESYARAQKAASDYLGTLQSRSNKELGAYGVSSEQAKYNDGKSAIDDKFNQQASDLSASYDTVKKAQNGKLNDDQQKQYERELLLIQTTQAAGLKIYEDTYNKRKVLEADWRSGVTKSMADYMDTTTNAYTSAQGIATRAFKGMEDALVSLVRTGKADFGSLANSIINDMIRIQAQKAITNAIQAASSGGGISGMIAAGAKLLGFANGGDPPVGVPSIVGENGPEIFVPKQSGTIIPNGSPAGAGALGGGAITVNQPLNLTVTNASPETVAMIRSMMPNFIAENKRVIEGVIQQAMARRGGRLSA